MVGDEHHVVVGIAGDQQRVVALAIGRVGGEGELALVDDVEALPLGRGAERRRHRLVARLGPHQHQHLGPVAGAEQLFHRIGQHAIRCGCVEQVRVAALAQVIFRRRGIEQRHRPLPRLPGHLIDQLGRQVEDDELLARLHHLVELGHQ